MKRPAKTQMKKKNSGGTVAARALRILLDTADVYRNFLQRNYDTLAGLRSPQEMAELEQQLAELERVTSVYAANLTPAD